MSDTNKAIVKQRNASVVAPSAAFILHQKRRTEMSDTNKAIVKQRNASVVAPSVAPSVIARLADRFGVDQSKMLECLKSTAFRGGCTNEQLMALCIVSEQYGLNPWTREIYAFPDKQNGIVPVVGVDGWARIINSHPQFDGVEFEQDSDKCTCSIYRKDRSHPVQVTEYMEECKRNTGPWGSHPMRMLRHKALIQAARLAFGFTGIYDQDEAERIVSARVGPAAYAKASPLDSVVVPQSDGVPKGDDSGSVAEPQEPQEPLDAEDVPYWFRDPVTVRAHNAKRERYQDEEECKRGE